MKLTQQQYDEKKYEFTLQNDNNMTVKLLNYGATLEKILLPNSKGKLENVILSLDKPNDYDKERNYLGGSVGRVIGRIKDGLWQESNGKIHHFVLNENNKTHSHGGYEGIDTQIFSFQTQSNDDSCSVIFHLIDPNGHNNYPGNLDLTIIYTLDNTDTLAYEVSASSDQTTLCNIANHVYFSLDGPNTSIENNQLKINADNYLPLDKDHLPFGKQNSVENSVFDFKKFAQIGPTINSNDPQIKQEGGLNHPFLLDGNPLAVELKSSDNTKYLKMTTTNPSIVVYTGNHFNHTNFTKNIGKYGGIALEAQYSPTNDIHLPDIVLTPDDQYYAKTTWNFTF
jgi:aldose 1-epimerase